MKGDWQQEGISNQSTTKEKKVVVEESYFRWKRRDNCVSKISKGCDDMVIGKGCAGALLLHLRFWQHTQSLGPAFVM